MQFKVPYIESVRDVVTLIPSGRVTTYGAIADFLSLGSARMVGWALNKAGLIGTGIPAHRVVNRNGELTGRLAFGDTMAMQRALEREGVQVENDRVKHFKSKYWHPEELLKV